MLRTLFVIFSLLISFSQAFANTPYVPSVVPSKEEVLRVKENDIILGCPEAQNVMIEYSSLSCPHCADYYKNVFPKIKSELINKCKVKYVYRDFPTTRSALKATALVRCVSMDVNQKVNPDEFFRLIQTLFSSQSSWAFSSDYENGLSKILSIVGIPQEKISMCINDNEIATNIVSSSFLSMKSLKMSHSPSLFINGVELQSLDYNNITSALK
jgi:protein-disulfide isomerase